MQSVSAPGAKPYRGMAMEGKIAAWYARNTEKMLAEFRADAKRIAASLPENAQVLEIAPGPGYLAIELAKLGPYRITGLDISQCFVRMAAENAARAGVAADFRQGDAAALPFRDDTFDFTVCRAAFKNFTDPVGALSEMHRVLRPGGTALIIDLRKDVSDDEIGEAVAGMHLSRLDALITRAIFKYVLRRRAYRREDFERMLAATPFGHGNIVESTIGFDMRLIK